MELLRSVRGNLRDSWALDNESAERFRPEKKAWGLDKIYIE